jgi:hypothetical protein
VHSGTVSMLCRRTFRISPDATTSFSSRIRRTRLCNSNPYTADASVASESVCITVPLVYQSQMEFSGSGSGRMPSMISVLANHALNPDALKGAA